LLSRGPAGNKNPGDAGARRGGGVVRSPHYGSPKVIRPKPTILFPSRHQPGFCIQEKTLGLAPGGFDGKQNNRRPARRIVFCGEEPPLRITEGNPSQTHYPVPIPASAGFLYSGEDPRACPRGIRRKTKQPPTSEADGFLWWKPKKTGSPKVIRRYHRKYSQLTNFS